jgi:hypothetical protein
MACGRDEVDGECGTERRTERRGVRCGELGPAGPDRFAVLAWSLMPRMLSTGSEWLRWPPMPHHRHPHLGSHDQRADRGMSARHDRIS